MISENIKLSDIASIPASFQPTIIPQGTAQDLLLDENYLEFGLTETVDNDDWMKKSCIERGSHYWICESPEKKVSLSTPLEMQCKDCSMNVLMRDRGGKKQTKLVQTRASIPNKRPQITNSTSFIGTKNIDHDLLYDALCYLGTGTIGTIERLTAECNLDLWGVQKLLISYSDLGMLDLNNPKNSTHIKSWSVPDPAAVLLNDGTICLTGFRSDKVLLEIKDKVEQCRGVFEVIKKVDRPSKIIISGLALVILEQFTGQ